MSLIVVGTNVQADLERAEREIEQLRVDHEVTLEKRERQVLKVPKKERSTAELFYLLCLFFYCRFCS